MKKKIAVGAIAAGVLLFSAIGASSSPPRNASVDTTQPAATSKATQNTSSTAATPICDGVKVTNACTLDGVNYATYVYHAAVAEKSHNETTTTYKQQVTGYCTLCVDGTYSPSCAMGRGACSYHGGVQEWNAPRHSNVPEYSTQKVIDMPAKEAYYEKVTEQ